MLLRQLLRDVRQEDGIDATIFQNFQEISEQELVSNPRPKYISEHVDWVEKLMVQIAAVTGVIAKAAKMRLDNIAEGVSSTTDEPTVVTGIIGTATSVVKDNVTAEGVARTASVVGDYAKVVPGGMSALFHLVVLGVRLVASCAEAGRGRRELLKILVGVVDHLHSVTVSLVPVLQSALGEKKSEEILQSNVFEVLAGIFDVMGKIEERLMKYGLA